MAIGNAQISISTHGNMVAFMDEWTDAMREISHTAATHKTHMKYKYKVEQIGGSMELIEQELNKLGAEGWQLIQIDDYKYIFMRENEVHRILADSRYEVALARRVKDLLDIANEQEADAAREGAIESWRNS